ncbi:MAG: MBL fold metallo-hydrolase, partial [Ktedonobacteraceae bacterium]|nr:MBL fold metallo-hydrolase [Ktedonobacteraceae bacterium]
MAQRFLVRFWGVRGSYPTPGFHTLRHGGNTSCVEVQAGTHTLVFDAGSGIIRLGDELLRRMNGTTYLGLFLTHAHADHLVGFPFFSPLFDARTNIHLFGPRLANRDIEQIVTPVMSPPYFPVDVRQLPSQRTFHTVTDDLCVTWHPDQGEPLMNGAPAGKRNSEEVRVLAKITQSHPLNGAVVYSVEYAGRRVVYATDVEWRNGCEPEFLTFVEGADLLIHDAQYTANDYRQGKYGFGHSTVEMAVEAAKAAHVRELILFHHEPTYTDSQLDAME